MRRIKPKLKISFQQIMNVSKASISFLSGTELHHSEKVQKVLCDSVLLLHKALKLTRIKNL